MVHPHIQLVTPSLSCGFRNRLVALGTTHDWAPHSPDLNPLDYWFWGAAKGSVYANCPATLDDLKKEVSDYLQAVPRETYRKVGQNFGVGINACLRGHTSRTSITRILCKCQFQTLGSHKLQQ